MEEQKQYAMFPLKHQEIFDMYQEQVSNFWTATEYKKNPQQILDRCINFLNK